MKLKLLLVIMLQALGHHSPLAARNKKEPVVPLGSRRPIVAVWCKDQGGPISSGAQYLRVAIWADGRVLFAADPTKWNQNPLHGRISAARIEELKKGIAETGVFDLKGTCYLVPDADVYCTLVDFGGRQQMLYWDELENPHYGINIDPKPHHLKFKECWKAVSRLALACRPTHAKRVRGRFGPVPRFWYIREARQSE